jgi:hypothetical protein
MFEIDPNTILQRRLEAADQLRAHCTDLFLCDSTPNTVLRVTLSYTCSVAVQAGGSGRGWQTFQSMGTLEYARGTVRASLNH